MHRRRIVTLAIASLVVALGATHVQAKTRVTCAGDSITKGAGAPRGKSYPDQLGKLLGAQYAVSAFGASGRTVTPAAGRTYLGDKYYKRAMASRPNIVVIMLGTNDAKLPQVNKEKFLANYKAIVKNFAGLKTQPKIFLCTPPPVTTGAYGFSDETISKQIIPLIEQVAKEMKLPLVDCYTPLKGKTEELLSDGCHPNEKGAAVLAKTIAAALKAGDKKADEKAAPKASASSTPVKAPSGAVPFPVTRSSGTAVSSTTSK